MLVAKSATMLKGRPWYPLVRARTAGKSRLVSHEACEQRADSDFATNITVDAGGEVSGPVAKPFSVSTRQTKHLGITKFSEPPSM